jgi:hypothetical protein
MEIGTSIVWIAIEKTLENPHVIQQLWNKVADTFWRKRKTIAVTGLSGAGKTVLRDYLRSAGRSLGYSPPATSYSTETGKLSATYRQNMRSLEEVPHKQIELIVIPGEEGGGTSRRQILEKHFGGENPPDVVIHVVCYGYILVRHPLARQALVKEGKLETLNAFREFQLQRELDDLDSIIEWIRRAQKKHKKPSWMLVAANKFDLYHEDHLQVEQYYSPYGKSKFVDKMKKLRNYVGEDDFEWNALPIFGWREPFEWNDEYRNGKLNDKHRDYFLLQFAELLEKISARDE